MSSSDMKRLLDMQHKYKDLFDESIIYLESHPNARIRSMCINETSPYIWFQLDEDDIEINTEFILKSDNI